MIGVDEQTVWEILRILELVQEEGIAEDYDGCDIDALANKVAQQYARSENGMLTNSFEFTVNAGGDLKEGKLWWPTLLVLHIPKYKVLSIISQLAEGLKYSFKEPISFVFQGDIKTGTEETL